ncbi:hypothetical protein BJX99DRAFT_136233 [Aspergillus californicus]
MVFLRLTVKVFPREQAPASNSIFRAFLPGDRQRDDSTRNSSGATTGKPASFLIVLEKPEDVTLGGLAGMIRAKWRKLRPGVEALEIKKLVDDDHESDDLDTDMTVADVFVDNGKARADGHDQRRTVRIIQKPVGGTTSPVRFPSVSQDWDAAAEKYEMQRTKEKREADFARKNLGSIAEETHDDGSTSPNHSWSDYTPGRKHRRDVPVSSVEKDDEVPLSPTQPAQTWEPSPDGNDLNVQNGRLESQELGDSPPSSRAATPREKLNVARPGSAHSQNSADRCGSDEAPVSDSPGLQLVQEATHSVSPQKSPQKIFKKERHSDDDSEVIESESEDDSEEEHDKDGDIAMNEPTSVKQQSPLVIKEAAKAIYIPTEDPSAETQSRKRKNSAEQLSPNKERRLDRSTPPAAVNSEKPNGGLSTGSPKYSPSGRRLSSFSGVARRLSFSERPLEPPKQGLGLGITRSPPKKRPSVMLDLSQDSAKSSQEIPRSTPQVPTSSAPTERRGSLAEIESTPTNLHTPADRVKNLHSALRNSSTEKRSERRSVSFAEGDDLPTGLQPVPKSTPADATDSSKSTPASRASSSDNRRSSGGSMKYPAGIDAGRLIQYEREAQEKVDRQNKEREEYKDKLEAAQTSGMDPTYTKKVQEAYDMWQEIVMKGHRTSDKAKYARMRAELDKLHAEIKEFEDVMSKSSQPAEKKSKSSRKSKPSKSQTSPEAETFTKPKKASKSPKPQSKTEDSIASPKPATAEPTAVKPTAATTVKGNPPSVTHDSGWQAVNNGNAPTSLKAPTLTNGTNPSSTPEKSAPTAKSKSRTQKSSKPASIESQNSTASDEVELPAMKIHARTNNTTKPTPPKSAPVSKKTSSSEPSDSSEDETSSDANSSSSSESESESESESDSKKKNARPTTFNKTPSSAQRNAKTPALSSQQTTSQSQTWTMPKTCSQAARPSLKSLKGQLAANRVTAYANSNASKRPVNAPARKDVFSPPSDSEDTESESESSSSSDSSDSDEEKEKKKEMKRGKENKKPIPELSMSPASVVDAGDIMSTGQVQRLRPARMSHSRLSH